MRWWLAIALVALGIAAAWAMPPEQQIIMFGGQSSASGSGGGGGGCTMNGTFDLTNTCNDIYLLTAGI